MNLTPNFNLIQPGATDPFADFRAWYNQTLSIIDANLGGGGSKHTIIDENGQALPNRSFLEFTGGVQVTDDVLNDKTVVDITGGGGGSSTLAGLTDVDLTSPTDGQVLTYNGVSQEWENASISGGTYNVYGAFIDTNNVIVSNTTFNSDTTYTATEDCVVRYSIATSGGTNGQILIDGVQIEAFYTQSTVVQPTGIIFIKRGQTVTFKPTYPSGVSSYAVYGIQQGTNQVGEHYSTSEQVIGTYFGKPLYRKSYQPTLTGQQNVINHGIADFKECVRIYGVTKYNNLNETLPLPYTSINLNYAINLGNVTPTTFMVERGIGFSSLQDCVVHLEYTKTTD